MNPSERVPLGKTNLTVTRLGFGSAPLGGLYEAVGENQADAVVERAWEVGLRLFDTAPLYGYGLAERRLGRILRRKPRQRYVLSTKVGRLIRPGAAPEPGQAFAREQAVETLNPVFDYAPDAIRQSLRESRERMGIERIDITLIHDPDQYYDQALHGAYPALARLRQEGIIDAVGAGMNQVEMLAQFARAADFDVFLLAGRYTLLDQSGLQELLPLALERGIAILAGGVYNSGILANPGPDATYDYAPAAPEILERAQQLEAIAGHYGVPLKAAAIQFPLGHPAVTSVVIGVRSVQELDENLAAFRHPIPAALWRAFKTEGLLAAEAPVPEGEG